MAEMPEIPVRIDTRSVETIIDIIATHLLNMKHDLALFRITAENQTDESKTTL